MELTRRNLLRTGLFGATALTVMRGDGAHALVATVCSDTVCPITAGQNLPAGTITASNTATDLVITIQLAVGVVFDPSKTEQVKIWTGTDFTLMPQTKNGNPKQGQFPFKSGACNTNGWMN